MALKKITHINLIGHNINVSIEDEYPTSDREVYCRKLHEIKEPDEKDCENCPYFSGFAMGWGHECTWEDEGENEEKVIPHSERFRELQRVSKLIDEKVLKKK